MENEIWKDVIGYEGLYQVSNLGNIKSINRIWITNNGAKRNHGDILIKQSLSYKGYLKVRFYKNLKRKTFFVHRLVAIAFVENPDNKPEINHKKGIKTDNRALELEWSTSSENTIHKFNVLGYQNKKGIENPLSRPVIQISFDGFIQNVYWSLSEAESGKVINKKAYYKCLRGDIKSYRGWIWK